MPGWKGKKKCDGEKKKENKGFEWCLALDVNILWVVSLLTANLRCPAGQHAGLSRSQDASAAPAPQFYWADLPVWLEEWKEGLNPHGSSQGMIPVGSGVTGVVLDLVISTSLFTKSAVVGSISKRSPLVLLSLWAHQSVLLLQGTRSLKQNSVDRVAMALLAPGEQFLEHMVSHDRDTHVFLHITFNLDCTKAMTSEAHNLNILMRLQWCDDCLLFLL